MCGSATTWDVKWGFGPWPFTRLLTNLLVNQFRPDFDINKKKNCVQDICTRFEKQTGDKMVDSGMEQLWRSLKKWILVTEKKGKE